MGGRHVENRVLIGTWPKLKDPNRNCEILGLNQNLANRVLIRTLRRVLLQRTVCVYYIHTGKYLWSKNLISMTKN